MHKTIIMIGLALLLPLGTASAGSPLKKYNALSQQKVCLTSIGWCSAFSKRMAGSTSCYCRNHQQNPGRVTTLGVILSTVPQID
jgi:hypothetical protein